MKATYKLFIAVALAFAQVIAPSLIGRAGGGSFLMAQDAFYVYRNDGDFNGFFYDQVIRMGYSKVDLDSVEHDIYVIQEIETADSLYRIPLAAIDSIGFVQPEIRFNPRLKDMDATGMADYASINYMNMRFEKGTPKEMIPEVGDVLVSFDQEKYGKDGFMGKVKHVQRWSTGTVDCSLDSISDWADIFDQFITVEQIGVDDEGKVHRRVAGFDENGRLRVNDRKDISGNLSLNVINWSGRLQYDWGNGLTIGIDAGIQVKAQATFAVTGVFSKRFFMKLIFSESLSAGASVHAQISGGNVIPINTPLGVLGGIKFPAIFPLFEVDPLPKGFFRHGGSIDASIQLPKFSFGVSQTITIDTEDPRIMWFDWGNQDGDGTEDNVESDFSWIDAGVVFNGYVQAGVMAQLGLNTNSWLSKLLHAGIGLEVYFGPKLEAELNLSASGALASGSYGALKDSRVALTPVCIDRELKYKWRVGQTKEERTLWSDTKKWGEYSLYLLPEFLKTKVDYNVTDRVLSTTIYPRRQVVMGSTIGIGVYPKDKWDAPIAEVQNTTDYSYTHQYNEFSTQLTKLEAGTYNVGPYVQMFGVKLPVNDDKVYTKVTIPPVLKLSVDSVKADTDSQKIEIPFSTNSNQVQVTVVKTGGAPVEKWLKAEVSNQGTGERQDTLTLDLKGNETVFGRGADVILTAQVDSVIVSDTLHIRQGNQALNIKGVRAKVDYPALTTSKDWGIKNDGTPYEKSQTDVPTGYSYFNLVVQGTNVDGGEPVPCTATRHDDLVTITGSYHDVLKDEASTTEPDFTSIAYTSGGSSSERRTIDMAFTLVLDLSDASMRLVKATMETVEDYNYVSQYTGYTHDYELNPWEVQRNGSSEKTSHREKRLSFECQGIPCSTYGTQLIFYDQKFKGITAKGSFSHHDVSTTKWVSGERLDHVEDHSEATSVANPDATCEVQITLYTE